MTNFSDKVSTTKKLSVKTITEKYCEMQYTSKPIIVNEENSPLEFHIRRGKKTWYYRGTINKASKRINLGTYPSTSIYDVREKLIDIKRNSDNAVIGTLNNEKTFLESVYGDPKLYRITNVQELKEKLPRDCYLFIKKDLQSFREIKNALNYYLSKYINDDGKCSKKTADLTRQELKKIAEDYHYEKGRSANKAIDNFNLLKTFFKWCVNNDIVKFNPINDIKLDLKKDKGVRPNRVYSLKEVTKILNMSNHMQEPYKYIAPLMFLTGRRLSTLVSLKKDQINIYPVNEDEFSYRHQMWEPRPNANSSVIGWGLLITEINQEKSSKRGAASVHHEILLTKACSEIFKKLLQYKPESEWLFPKPNNSKEHIESGPNSNQKQMRLKIRELTGISDFKYGSIRTSVSTYLSELGVNENIARYIIGHASDDTLFARVYNKNLYRKEKLESLKKLEDLILGKIVINNNDLYKDLPTDENDYTEGETIHINEYRKSKYKNDPDSYEKSYNESKKHIVLLQALPNTRIKQLSTFNQYRKEVTKKPEINSINFNYLIEWSEIFKCIDSYLLLGEKDYIERAWEMYTEDMKEFLLAMQYNHDRQGLEFKGNKYLEAFEKIYRQFKKYNPKSNKYDEEKLKSIAPIFFHKSRVQKLENNENIGATIVSNSQVSYYTKNSPPLTNFNCNNLLEEEKLKHREAIKEWEEFHYPLNSKKEISPDSIKKSRDRYLKKYEESVNSKREDSDLYPLFIVDVDQSSTSYFEMEFEPDIKYQSFLDIIGDGVYRKAHYTDFNQLDAWSFERLNKLSYDGILENKYRIPNSDR
tara:strand:+ start:279 stop:2720 length:2442 start_codon:yes stop_codon:yes gene_type:complete